MLVVEAVRDSFDQLSNLEWFAETCADELRYLAIQCYLRTRRDDHHTRRLGRLAYLHQDVAVDLRVLTDEGKHNGAIRGMREANGGIRIVGAKIDLERFARKHRRDHPTCRCVVIDNENSPFHWITQEYSAYRNLTSRRPAPLRRRRSSGRQRRQHSSTNARCLQRFRHQIAARIACRSQYAPVAQLDRASACGAEGQRFKSSRVHHATSAEEARLEGRLFCARRSYAESIRHAKEGAISDSPFRSPRRNSTAEAFAGWRSPT